MRVLILLLMVLLFFFTIPAGADDRYNITGFVETDHRLTIEKETESRFVYNETTLGLAFSAFPTSGLSLLGSVQFDALAVEERPESDRRFDIEEQQDRNVVDLVRVELDEAYMMMSGLGLKSLDLKIGKQRIQWGTGDQFNPTDNLNPDDFHDPLKFGEKFATPAVRADYYAGPVTITGVYLPLFYPALLPITEVRPIFELQFEPMAEEFNIDTGNPRMDIIIDSLLIGAIKGADLGSVRVRSELPDPTFSNSSAALKVAASVWQIDLSASYAYLRDDFGVPSRVNIVVDPMTTSPVKLIDEVDLDVLQKFYRMQVIGADFAASIPVMDIGLWGEAAYHIPNEEFKTEYFLDTGQGVNAVLSELVGSDYYDGLVIAEDEPLARNFIKAVAGMDYTFPGAVYFNAQYVRGLPSDNTADLIDDYLFAGLDKPFFHDAVKPRIFSGVCFQDKSWILYPEITFLPMDSLEFKIGALFVFGELDTKFGAFGDDILFVKGKVSF